MGVTTSEPISEGYWVVEDGKGHREVICLDQSKTSGVWWVPGDEVDVKWSDCEGIGYRLIRKIDLWEDK